MNKIHHQRNNTISLLRVIATIEIVLCHFWPNLLKGYDAPRLVTIYPGIFFGNGVILFFIISGFLYGNKNIKNPFQWILKQFIKLTIPVVLLVFFESVRLLIVNGNISINFFVVHFLNLTGLINFNVFPFINAGYNVNLSHLWYLTAIFLCYLLTPLLQCIAARKRFANITICIFFLLSVVSSLFLNNLELPHYFVYLTVYTLSYCHGNDIFESFKNANRVVLMIFVYILSIGIYFLSFRIIGDSLFQDSVLSQLFRANTSFMIIAIIVYFGNRSDRFRQIQDSVLVHFLDSYSYYIYIFHTYIMFVVIEGFLGISISQWYFSFPLWIIIMILVCFIDKYFSSRIIQMINKCIEPQEQLIN